MISSTSSGRSAQRSEPGRLARRELQQSRELILTGIQPLPGQKFTSNHARRPHVAAPIEGMTESLLGCHVADLALDHAGLRRVQPRQGLGDAEVGEAAHAVDTDENILRRNRGE